MICIYESHILCDGRTLNITPDILADFRNLPFGDRTFSLITVTMTNYTLTTDLVKDCMALIPHNIERLEKGGFEMHYRVIFYDKTQRYIDFKFDNLSVAIPFIGDFDHENRYLFAFKKIIKYNSTVSMWLVSYCLRTIPEFQAENSQYKRTKKKLENNKNARLLDAGTDYILRGIISKSFEKTIKKYKYETIASATLHGQGEYPPSTLNELCESYKQVMSKQYA